MALPLAVLLQRVHDCMRIYRLLFLFLGVVRFREFVSAIIQTVFRFMGGDRFHAAVAACDFRRMAAE